MSREFKLVLLGAGLLTAGSFLWPDDDPIKRADEEAKHGGGSRGRYHGHSVFIFTSYTRTTTTSAPAAAGTSRGGFGRIGGFFSGG